jgi:hypothetical protein
MSWMEVIICFTWRRPLRSIYVSNMEQNAHVRLLSAFCSLVSSDDLSACRVAATHLTVGFERGCADSYAGDRRSRKSGSEPDFHAGVRQNALFKDIK